MNCERIRHIGFLLTAVLLLASCSSTKVRAPGPSTQAILVIPVELDAKVVSIRHSFYYVYEIAKVGDPSFSHNVDIKFPLPDRIVIVDGLPPGDYYVSRFTYLPIGGGDIVYGENTLARNDRFSLEPGKITVFSKSLKVILRNRNPGRVGTIVYNFDILPTSRAQTEAILTTLAGHSNFELWELQNVSTGAPLQKQAE